MLKSVSELSLEPQALTLPGHRSRGPGEVTFGIYAIWLLISGHHFDFCFIWSMTPSWWVSGFVGLIWACRHLAQTVQAKMGGASFKVPHSTWESFGKKFWMTGQPIATIQWQKKKVLDLYWHRMRRWTEVPFCPVTCLTPPDNPLQVSFRHSEQTQLFL